MCVTNFLMQYSKKRDKIIHRVLCTNNMKQKLQPILLTTPFYNLI